MEKSWNQDRNKQDRFFLLPINEVWWITRCPFLMVSKETNLFFFWCAEFLQRQADLFWCQAPKAVFVKPLSAKIIVVYSHRDDPRTMQHAHVHMCTRAHELVWFWVTEAICGKRVFQCADTVRIKKMRWGPVCSGVIVAAPNYCWSWLHTRDVWIGQCAAECMIPLG